MKLRSDENNENDKHQEQAFRPVPPENLFIVEQAGKPVAKKAC
ncbi:MULTISPECIES: hypothetical protein [unclassified Microcoleus]